MTEAYGGNWVLVTGASAGIGAEFARQFAARGANVALVARRADKLEALAREINAGHGVEARAVPCDLADAAERNKLPDLLGRQGIVVDHLVNNAGFGTAGPFAGSDGAREAAMVRLNCEAIVELSHRFVPGMLERRRGGVINVASTAAYQPLPFMATYAASKAFVLSFSLALAEELQDSEVRVLALCPGPVPTEFQQVARIELKAERVAVLSAEQTVSRALAGYAAGRRLIVPGALNKAGATLARLVPWRVTSSVVARAMKRNGRART
jgi:uncharacterized protein